MEQGQTDHAESRRGCLLMVGAITASASVVIALLAGAGWLLLRTVGSC